MTGSPGVAQKSSAVTKYILFTFLCLTLVLSSAFLIRLHPVGSIGKVRAQADEVRLHEVCAECGSDQWATVKITFQFFLSVHQKNIDITKSLGAFWVGSGLSLTTSGKGGEWMRSNNFPSYWPDQPLLTYLLFP